MKRGTSGLSLVVAVDKPIGMTSHDVVNRCRRIFNERRVGHTGTLDPLATGVLPICVGPATRLDRYMTGHDKRYRVTMRFGFETTTDDSQGDPTVAGPVGDDLLDGDFAETYVEGLVGTRKQIPPAYSAVKVGGRKAYEIARAGEEVELEPRDIEIYHSKLVERTRGDDGLKWVIDFSVSKGTYIRALVRDIGRELGSPAHVSALQRRSAGKIALEECVSLDTLETLGVKAAIDPTLLLGYRIAFADDFEKQVNAGAALEMGALFEQTSAYCSCTSSLSPSPERPYDGELVSVIVANRLKAIYRYDAKTNRLKPDCVFSLSIARS